MTATAQSDAPSREVPCDLPAPDEGGAFARQALRLAGKSDEEVNRTGAVDEADEQVEALFAERYQTASSPIHRAVWDEQLPVELFGSTRPAVSPSARAQDVMRHSMELVRRRRDEATLLDAQGKIGAETLDELARAGYWGLLIDPQY